MNFLPFENITYTSRLKEEEISKRLNDMISIPETWRPISFNFKPSKPFEGKIEGHDFEFKRIASNQAANLSRPIIKGKIENGLNELVIYIKMRLSPLFFILIGGLVTFFIVLMNLSTTSGELYFAKLGIIWIAGGNFIIGIIRFNLERKKIRKLLQEIFESEIINR
ncbi:MAG TPA: hypothetical protein VK890_06565 [Bacteroidia bacterium]|jgi:hypothetical protein|nr:hypothetical protein [Bacteroidia bacterium]